jgi:hypothetical protein
MTQRIGNPFPMFFDRYGRPLTGGKLYIGTGGDDPQSNPIDVFFDDALTVSAVQPINVIGGLATNNGNPAQLYVAESQYSLRARDADGAEVFYSANAVFDSALYQPADSDLTAIAALTTTAFGRALLTMADGPAVRAAIGVVASLPLTGGSLTGEVKRSGAGAYPYMVDAAFTVARIFVTANGASDPRTQIGDFWYEEEA